MPTRRDQLQAYRFQQRRAVAALVTGKPNARDAPLRRLTLTTLSGVMIAILVAAGFTVLGLLRPTGNDDWRADGAVIVTNETAAIYVRIDGVLHPVLNYASAVLAVSGAGQPKIVHVDRRVLDGARRGSTIGIAGLPSSLPSADDLASAPFTVCARTRAGTTRSVTVSVDIGHAVTSTPVAASTGVVVRSAGDGFAYLIVGGRRLAIGSAQVATSLQVDTSQAVTVGTAFLSAIAAGVPLRTPTVADAGRRYASRIAGHSVRVGQLLHDTDDDRFLLVLPDGVAELDDVQTRLLETLSLPPRNAITAPVDVSRSDVIALPQSRTGWPAVARQFAGLPTSVPRTSTLASRRGGLCAQYRAGSSTPTLAVPSGLRPDDPLPDDPLSTVTQSSASARGIADSVTISGGHAAVVRSGDHSTTYLVGEPGRRYPAIARGALADLGYADVTPVNIPAQVVALIPTGNALDPVAARRPVTN